MGTKNAQDRAPGVWEHKAVQLTRRIGLLLAMSLLALLSITFAAEASTLSPGTIDLRGDALTDGLVDLDGEWEFYWEQLLEPEDFRNERHEMVGYVSVPGAWNGYQVQEQDFPGQGYATYRVEIKIAEGQQLLGIHLPRILTAYRLWINGEPAAAAGEVGRAREDVTPQYLPRQVFFYPAGSTVELIIQTANFHHRSGGILESIQFGTADQVQAATHRRLAYDLFLFGGLFLMGIYHLVLFFYRRSERSLLYFGLFCILVSIRTLFVGQIFFIQQFPNLNWELAHKIQTLTYYVGVHVIILFFRGVFPSYVSPTLVRVSSVVVATFSTLVLFLPARQFTVFNPLFQVFTLLVIGYVISVLLRVSRRREAGTVFIVTGAAVLFLTVGNDILYLSILRSDYHAFQHVVRMGNLSALGMLAFVFTHSLVLAITFSQAFKKNEEMTLELASINDNLETTVARRTKDLVAANSRVEAQKLELEAANRSLATLSFKDPLTGLWNRRRFEESLGHEWKRALRTGDSLSLIFVDIDDFKAFNDQHGHLAGDECLQKVAQMLEKSVNRAGDIVVRYGGEEFVVLLPATPRIGAAQIAEGIREGVRDLRIPQAASVEGEFVTVTLGVATVVPTWERSPQGLVEASDRAMYVAKEKGKNRVELVVLDAAEAVAESPS